MFETASTAAGRSLRIASRTEIPSSAAIACPWAVGFSGFSAKAADADDSGSFLGDESAKEAHLDQPGLVFIAPFEFRQGVIRVDHEAIAGGGHIHRLVERQAHAAVTLAGFVLARMVDKNLAHDARRDSEEVSTILIVGLILPGQTEVGFVDQGGPLESVARALAAEAGIGETAQFRVDDREQPVHSGSIAGFHLAEQLRDRGGRCGSRHGQNLHEVVRKTGWIFFGKMGIECTVPNLQWG
jgi:hypothetical protein